MPVVGHLLGKLTKICCKVQLMHTMLRSAGVKFSDRKWLMKSSTLGNWYGIFQVVIFKGDAVSCLYGPGKSL